MSLNVIDGNAQPAVKKTTLESGEHVEHVRVDGAVDTRLAPGAATDATLQAASQALAAIRDQASAHADEIFADRTSGATYYKIVAGRVQALALVQCAAGAGRIRFQPSAGSSRITAITLPAVNLTTGEVVGEVRDPGVYAIPLAGIDHLGILLSTPPSANTLHLRLLREAVPLPARAGGATEATLAAARGALATLEARTPALDGGRVPVALAPTSRISDYADLSERPTVQPGERYVWPAVASAGARAVRPLVVLTGPSGGAELELSESTGSDAFPASSGSQRVPRLPDEQNRYLRSAIDVPLYGVRWQLGLRNTSAVAITVHRVGYRLLR
jgi:hypothetical protein